MGKLNKVNAVVMTTWLPQVVPVCPETLDHN